MKIIHYSFKIRIMNNLSCSCSFSHLALKYKSTFVWSRCFRFLASKKPNYNKFWNSFKVPYWKQGARTFHEIINAKSICILYKELYFMIHLSDRIAKFLRSHHPPPHLEFLHTPFHPPLLSQRARELGGQSLLS